MSSVNIDGGDHVHVSMFYQPSNDQANFIVQDETKGVTANLTVTVNQAKYFDGRDADFIIEKPTGTTMQNFNSISWSSAKIQNQLGNWNYLGDVANQVKMLMKNGSTTLVSTGAIGGASNGAFTSTWQRCS
jgi:GTPase involved in cell partitioning and DNA repair